MRIDRLVVATGNPHKLREIHEILAPYAVEVLGPEAVGGLPEVIEDGDTFAANAIKKARSACVHCGLPALADDSGIEARAIDWQPGVYSARYAGEPCDDDANNRKLVAALSGVEDRFVQYRCVIALVRPGCEALTWDGVFPGQLIDQPRGSGGFGYDPFVLLPDCGLTVAELDSAEKHARSHRGQALRAFAHWLGEQA